MTDSEQLYVVDAVACVLRGDRWELEQPVWMQSHRMIVLRNKIRHELDYRGRCEIVVRKRTGTQAKVLVAEPVPVAA